MKKNYLLLLAALIPFFGFNQEIYSKVKIFATNAQLVEISNLGVTVDHGKHKQNTWFITDLSESDISILEENHFPYEVLIEDMATYSVEHAYDTSLKSDREDCGVSGSDGGGFDPETPSNFHTGSMGGYFTYEQYLNELDEMRAAYPDLITEKQGIGSFTTWEDRLVHWVRISDNAEMDEDEAEVLYTSIHHAREPMSLSQTIFYMWYVLENYGTDDEVTFLVDNTEMYFVPMVNPDGYKWNQTTNPGGGGFHRKNRNPSIGSFNSGVDLNRNYSYKWDESGTSDDENSDVFPGIGPFSEPESQAIKWFVENHEFQFAFNAHAHGDLLLFPLGWTAGEFAADHSFFAAYSDNMSRYNGYDAIKASDLSVAAGDSDDWMYSEAPNVFAITPEVGNSFWPPISAIIPTCKEMVSSNLILSHMPHIYGVTNDLIASTVNTETGFFNYNLHRFGLMDGAITISITPLVGIDAIGAPNMHTLTILENKVDSISYELTPGINFGDEIKFILHTDNGTWVRNDTITKSFGQGEVVFSDDISDISNWTGDWGITNELSFSPTTSITDSPFDGTYGNNVNSEIRLNESFSFEDATYANVTFWAQWEIENDFDYVQFLASNNGGVTWTPLCGKHTNLGVDDQILDSPLYDGNQNDWVLEEIDLSDYIGDENVEFKFQLVTDAFVELDGFYFDDFSIFTDASQEDSDASGIEEINNADIRIYPNPANQEINISVSTGAQVKALTIHNDLGQVIREVNVNTSSFSVADLAEGVYYLRITDVSNTSTTKRFTVIR